MTGSSTKCHHFQFFSNMEMSRFPSSASSFQHWPLLFKFQIWMGTVSLETKQSLHVASPVPLNYFLNLKIFIFLFFSSFSSSLFFHQILHQQTLWNWHINPNSWVSFDELTYFFRSLTDNNDNSIFFSFSFFVCSPFSSLLSSVLRCCLLKSCSLIFGYKSRFIFGFNLFQ